MQVDGEACKLTPSIISMTILNQASMLAKRKGGKSNIQWANTLFSEHYDLKTCLFLYICSLIPTSYKLISTKINKHFDVGG
jgi:hypothetical protein